MTQGITLHKLAKLTAEESGFAHDEIEMTIFKLFDLYGCEQINRDWWQRNINEWLRAKNSAEFCNKLARCDNDWDQAACLAALLRTYSMHCKID